MTGGTRGLRTFQPSARLRHPKEFSIVLASPLRSRAGCFELRYAAREGQEQARLGLVIPKRLAKRAVLRNLIKRLARESFRDLATGLPRVDIVLRLVAPAEPGAEGPRVFPRELWRRQMDFLLNGISKRQAT